MHKLHSSWVVVVICLLPLVGCHDDDDQASSATDAEHFSFFVTSLRAMQDLSGSEDGFGGDLRFGETGPGAGLRGADKICTTIAEKSMPRNGKTWRAFLSVTGGDGGEQVDAIDRVGDGPWYDRTGRLLAARRADLLQTRPAGADAAIINDLPNEDGVPNHAPDPIAGEVDNHDVLTGTDDQGRLYSEEYGDTCNDWTSAEGAIGTPHCGHSWPRGGAQDGPMRGPGGPAIGGQLPEGGAFTGGPIMMIMEGGAPADGVMLGAGGEHVIGGPAFGSNGSGDNWMSALDEAGCAPGAFIVENGPPGANGTLTVGDGGGYGAIYCFALSP